MSADQEQTVRGVKRLMLKIPVLRGPLEILSRSHREVQALCGAFDDASTALEQLRRRGCDPSIIQDYEQICSEIEEDVVNICKEAFER